MQGRVKVGLITKQLVPRLSRNCIAVLQHRDLDVITAKALINKGIRAVLNAEPCITGRFPNEGPKLLLEAGILVIDNLGTQIFSVLRDNDRIDIKANAIYKKGKQIGQGRRLTLAEVNALINSAHTETKSQLELFINNTLAHLQAEKSMFLSEIKLPELKTRIDGRHCLVVVRGRGYLEDLKMIKSYIKEVKPVLIGVDGGADALLDMGFRPDIVIGDMDSVSDKALRCSNELVVHAYPNGIAPGLKRVENIRSDAKLFSVPGTSEDAALLLAYEKNAKLIVAVGTHSNMIDFLEKGREGMASTLLVRLKVGPKLIDVRGVSELYKPRPKAWYLAALISSAAVPILLLAMMSPTLRIISRLLIMKLLVIFTW